MKHININKVTLVHHEDTDPDISYLQQDWHNEEDNKRQAERLDQYHRSVFEYIGIYAEAEIITKNGIIQTIRSGGVWGIESDFKEEIEEVETEQLNELLEELAELGFDISNVPIFTTEDRA